jgi:hypothetical protein
MIFFSFIAHWLACIWFVIGFYQAEDNRMGKGIFPLNTTGWVREFFPQHNRMGKGIFPPSIKQYL